MSTTAFQRALDEYFETVPRRKQKSKFIVACYNSSSPVTPEYINRAMQKAEENLTQRGFRKILTRVLSPMISSLKDYFKIVDALTSSSMPASIIWGALKVIIEGLDRHFTLFDTIKSQLRTLNVLLQRITEYEELYSESSLMQSLLSQTYVHILRFWASVDKECDQYGIRSVLAMASTFKTRKLDEIIQEIEKSAADIEKLAPIIEARHAKGEREDTKAERIAAGIERLEAQEERKAQKAWRETQQADRRNEQYMQVASWLDSRDVLELNQNQHLVNLRRYCPETCLWVSDNQEFAAWRHGTEKPSILWLNTAPGTGKSILCSYVIDLVRKSDPSAEIAHLFYQFDHPYSAAECLRLICAQLVTSRIMRGEEFPQDLYERSQLPRSLENLSAFFTALVQQSTSVYIFLDGLDEEDAKDRWKEAVTPLELFLDLAVTNVGKVRLWCSSQDRPLIREKLGAYSSTGYFSDQMKDDVDRYLLTSKVRLQEWGIEHVLDTLRTRHGGSFLWANLMVNAVCEETSSPLEVKNLVGDSNNLPSTLDAYYRRIFSRFATFQRPLVCKVFSFIAFARRPLRMGELREAVGMIDSTSSSLERDAMPFPDRLIRLFAPLIETSSAEGDDPKCRLFHSTVKAFIVRVGGRVFDDSNLIIDPELPGRACLAYLSQPRYSQLLWRRDARWVDYTGEDVGSHHLLVYAGKYWDKHLDDIPGNSEIRERITHFILSPNFQTYIQILSLWVEHKFTTFTSSQNGFQGQYLLRVFPAWYIRGMESSTERKLWAFYRQFLHNWLHFLDCSNCGNPQCYSAYWAGEIDRCWWSALGPSNFLWKFQGRYVTFALQNENDELMPWPTVECVGTAGEQMVILKLIERLSGTLTFSCETWSIPHEQGVPNRQSLTRLTVQEYDTNYALYSAPLVLKTDVRRVPFASFSDDCQYLRIGAKLFRLTTGGNYVPMWPLSIKANRYPEYVEEFAIQNQVVVVATRQHITQKDLHQTGVTDESIVSFGPDFNAMEAASVRFPTRADDDDEDWDESDESSSSSTDSEEANESWSEGDSDYSDVLDDDAPPWLQSPDLDSASGSESEIDDGDSDIDSYLPLEAIVDPDHGLWDDDAGFDEDDGGRMDVAYAYRPEFLEEHPSHLKSSIVIYLTDSATNLAKPVFHLTQRFSATLYSSQPVVHPSKPLVVWPISRGDILFADYRLNTYFIRTLKPSTTYTAHISIQCHFSACGSYLHIAAFEGRREPEMKYSIQKPPLQVAILILTYRLSSSKPTRSPPQMISRARTDLGWTPGLSASNLPFTVTWTPKDAYVTCSDRTLRVYRLNLFTKSGESSSSVSTPRNALLLPNTASQRKVHYYPSDNLHHKARVIIGSEHRSQAAVQSITTDMHGYHSHHGNVFGLDGAPVPVSSPVGCLVDDELDLGGWDFKPVDMTVADNVRVGQLELDPRLEKFDYDDDFDLEPYMF